MIPRSAIYAGLLAAGFTFASPPALAQEGDAEAGKRVFNQCAVCHTVEPGQHRLGPSLYGVIGRTPGTLEGFKYSPAMKQFGESGAVWDEETLMRYLENPRKVVPGTRMAFPGLRDPEARADVIEYLESVGGDGGEQ